MKYLEINSKFIDREFSSMMSRALDEIRHYVRKNTDKGNLDCAMSKFGQSFDQLVSDYFIDHVRFCRKYGHTDENTINILRVLNTYKKVGVHEMFKKLYPKYFEVKKEPVRSKSFDAFASHEALRRLYASVNNVSGQTLIDNVSMLLSEHKCNHTVQYVKKFNLLEGITEVPAVTSLYNSIVKETNLGKLITDIIRGKRQIHNELNKFEDDDDDVDIAQPYEPPSVGIPLDKLSFNWGSYVSTYGTTGSNPVPIDSVEKTIKPIIRKPKV